MGFRVLGRTGLDLELGLWLWLGLGLGLGLKFKGLRVMAKVSVKVRVSESNYLCNAYHSHVSTQIPNPYHTVTACNRVT